MTQNLELVEKLVEKTGLSYSEAKAALEKTDWDILEAIIMLESQGRVQGAKTTQYSTNTASEENKQDQNQKQNENQYQHHQHHRNRHCQDDCCAGENFKKSAKSFGGFMKDIFDKGNKNSIMMHRREEKLLDMPITAFVLLLVFCFWVIIPLMIVALFCGCRFSFSGNDLGKDSVNNAMGKASDIADNIKNEFKGENKDI